MLFQSWPLQLQCMSQFPSFLCLNLLCPNLRCHKLQILRCQILRSGVGKALDMEDVDEAVLLRKEEVEVKVVKMGEGKAEA